jgi:hypothetical protein
MQKKKRKQDTAGFKAKVVKEVAPWQPWFLVLLSRLPLAILKLRESSRNRRIVTGPEYLPWEGAARTASIST